MSVSSIFAYNFKSKALGGGQGAWLQIYIKTNKISYHNLITDLCAGILLGPLYALPAPVSSGWGSVLSPARPGVCLLVREPHHPSVLVILWWLHVAVMWKLCHRYFKYQQGHPWRTGFSRASGRDRLGRRTWPTSEKIGHENPTNSSGALSDTVPGERIGTKRPDRVLLCRAQGH